MLNISVYKIKEFRDYLIEIAGKDAATVTSYPSYLRSISSNIKSLDLNNTKDKIEYIDKVYQKLSLKGIGHKIKKTDKTISDWKSGLKCYKSFLIDELEIEAIAIYDDEVDEKELKYNQGSINIELNNKYIFDINYLKENFKFRLITQDRFSEPVFFHISLIKKLFYRKSEEHRHYFDHWLNETIDNIILFGNNDKKLKLKDIDSITIEFNKKGVCNYFMANDQTYELQTAIYNSSDYRPMAQTMLKYIVIDHIKSIDSILKENVADLKGLKILTEIVSKEIDKSNLRNSARIAGNNHFERLKGLDSLFVLLKNDLEIIKSKTKLQLMDKSENSAKRNN